MSRSLFGWSYPPGAANDPNAPYNQEEGPCEVCCQDVDHCVCPECPVCGTHGDPRCYARHGMEYTDEQCAAMARFKRNEEEQRAADEEAARERYYDQTHDYGEY